VQRNGPEVIEQESGVEELDASDRALIWAVHGGEQRVGMRLVDALVEDSIGEIASAVRRYVLAGTSAQHRSEQVPVYRERVAALDTLEQIDLLTCESCGVYVTPRRCTMSENT
jgi:malonate decarboxylase beta subunit